MSLFLNANWNYIYWVIMLEVFNVKMFVITCDIVCNFLFLASLSPPPLSPSFPGWPYLTLPTFLHLLANSFCSVLLYCTFSFLSLSLFFFFPIAISPTYNFLPSQLFYVVVWSGLCYCSPSLYIFPFSPFHNTSIYLFCKYFPCVFASRLLKVKFKENHKYVN